MRGHWESQTRKLNRHYQSGGGGGPAPIWYWEKYMASGVPAPYRFDHDLLDTNVYDDPNNYYNKVFTTVNDMYGGSNGIDLTRCYPFEGPVARRYDGATRSGQFTFNAQDDYYDWYMDQVSQQLRPIRDPDYDPNKAAFHLWNDCQRRFVRIHCPLYGYGPAYYYGDYPALYAPAHSEELLPTKTKFTAKGCRAAAEVYNRSQRITLYSERPGGGYTSCVMRLSNDNVFNIYDLEQAGQAYVEETFNNVLWDYENREYRNITFRVYVFIYDGDFFMELKPHLFDPVTGDELTEKDPWHVEVMRFPGTLSGVCEADPYVQPNEGFGSYPSPLVFYPTTPVTYTYSASDEYDQFVMVEGIRFVPIGGTPGVDIVQHLYNDPTNSQHNAKILDITESEFWAIEAAWHTLNGGTPYTPPTP